MTLHDIAEWISSVPDAIRMASTFFRVLVWTLALIFPHRVQAWEDVSISVGP